MQPQAPNDYWRAHLRLLGILLTIWFAVSYGAGILLVDWLNRFELGGFKLGFWMAQQGGIYAFIAIIFVYVWRVQKLEQRYRKRDDDDPDAQNHEQQP